MLRLWKPQIGLELYKVFIVITICKTQLLNDLVISKGLK